MEDKQIKYVNSFCTKCYYPRAYIRESRDDQYIITDTICERCGNILRTEIMEINDEESKGTNV